MLVAVGVAHLESCDFGNGIGLIGGLELPSQQGVFPHGLGGMLGVNAGAPQKKKLLHTCPTAALDDIRLHDEVVVEKVAPQSVVGMDATNFGGGEVNVPGLGLGQKRHHRLLVPQIQFLGGLEQQVVMACAFQRAYDGRSDHAAVACNVNGGVFVQRSHGGKVLREGLVKDGMSSSKRDADHLQPRQRPAPSWQSSPRESGPAKRGPS